MAHTAFITGASGQDFAYLAKLLLEKGYKVIGGRRRSASGDLWRLKRLGIENDTEIIDFELNEHESASQLFKNYQIDEFYNLAAQSFVASSFTSPIYALQTNGVAVGVIVEAIRNYSPQTRFYQASTSELYGKVYEIPQTENTKFYPRSPYGIGKLMGYWMTRNYREGYGLHMSNGILFNHESPLRGEEFVTRKITQYVAKYASGLTNGPLELGNINSKRDWGHSADYVEAMHLIMQNDVADDYVVATGKMHSVKEFVSEAFANIEVDITWIGTGIEEKAYINGKLVMQINPKFYRPCEVDLLLGNPEKIKKLGWRPKNTFESLVADMVQSDLQHIATI